MSPRKRKAITEKGKHERKKLRNTKTSSSTMADKQDGAKSSPKESGVKDTKSVKDKPVSSVLANEERRDSVEGDSVDIPFFEFASPVLKGAATIEQQDEELDRIQSQLVFSATDPRFWQAEYRKLEEVHGQYRDETSKQLTLLREKLANRGYENEGMMWDRFHQRKQGYSRDLGFRLFFKETNWEYGSISRAAGIICHDLSKLGIPTALLRASRDPEYRLIASECGHSWMRQLLSEDCEEGCLPISCRIAERVITKYVLRFIFDPMLIGLEKEVETLLLRVRACMESRMAPAMADKWMGETLRSYTLLQRYDQDRDYYLRSHTEYLRDFLEHFFPIPERTGWGDSAKNTRDKIPKDIIKPLADLATQMSFSYLKFEVDWDYCDKTTELFKKDLKDHEVFDFRGWRLSDRDLREVGSEEKIGDVVLFVRPPIFEVDRTTGTRQIHGWPVVVVKRVSSCDPSA